MLRGEQRTEDVIGYIIENPLRRGLVVDVRDYPHWGSSLYTREELLMVVAAGRV